MKYFFVLIIFTIGCENKIKVSPFTSERIMNMNTFDQLSVKEYLQLASSIDVLERIFSERDTSYIIFKELIDMGIDKPVIVIDGKKDFNTWITSQEIDWLRSIQRSKQPVIRLTNSYSSLIDTTKSTIGREAQFILRLFNGKSLMNSNS